jgi:hypothetical protein
MFPALAVLVPQVFYHLISEIITAGARDNRKICRIKILHGLLTSTMNA